MPDRVRVIQVEDRNVRAGWARSLGPGPYFWVQREYGLNDWESYLTLSIAQLKELHSSAGATLVKHAHAQAQQ